MTHYIVPISKLDPSRKTTSIGFYEWLEDLKDYSQELQKFYILREHERIHKHRLALSYEELFLECEICCGVPPWEWKDFPADVESELHQTYNIPSLRREKGKYQIYFTAFNWRSARDWGLLPYPMDECTICGKFSRVARHKDGFTYKQRAKFKASSKCLKCIKAENKALLNDNSPFTKKELDSFAKLARQK